MTPRTTEGVQVLALLEEKVLTLELVTGAGGTTRWIGESSVQKPGLAFAGHLESLHPARVQVVGYSEVSYLSGLPEPVALARSKDICALGIPCIIVTRDLETPVSLRAACETTAVPLLKTPLESAPFIELLSSFLASMMCPSTSTHGVLVDVFGVGILLLGKSGVGKSEAALDLVLRGHRLVADDIVEIRMRSGGAITGTGPEIIRHHMEIRGLGILNIKDLFGISAVREAKKLELVIELVEWDEREEYDRLGVEQQTHEILGVEVPLIRLPVRPGRNMASIIEVAARNQLLKLQGHYSAKEFQQRLVRAIAVARKTPAVGNDVE
jgi:HPr kinase/phosphorylase